MQPESRDPGNGQYYNEDSRRFAQRLADIEKDIVTLKVTFDALRGEFKAHLEITAEEARRNADEARRAGARQEDVLRVLNDVKGDMREFKARSGTISIQHLAWVAGIMGSIGTVVGVVVSLVVKGA